MAITLIAFLFQQKRRLIDSNACAGRETTIALKMQDLREVDWGTGWREEEPNPIAYFIKYARGLGMHGTYLAVEDSIRLRITRDAADEETITWPKAV